MSQALIKMDCFVEATVEESRGFICPPALSVLHRSFPWTTNSFIFHGRAKQPSWAASSLSHEQRRRQDDAQAGRSNVQTFIPTLLVWSLRADKQLVPSSHLCRSWILLVPDWLIGVCLFSKRREQVNEPWICAEWHGSRLTEQVAGQQEASSLNPLYSKSALDIPWQKSLIFTSRHESPVWMICREKGCFLGL